MKTIDVKSMIIGVLLTTTVLFGMGATGKADAGKWDDKQEWHVTYNSAAKRLALDEGYLKEVLANLYIISTVQENTSWGFPDQKDVSALTPQDVNKFSDKFCVFGPLQAMKEKTAYWTS